MKNPADRAGLVGIKAKERGFSYPVSQARINIAAG
jgi:hypothetical protein